MFIYFNVRGQTDEDNIAISFNCVYTIMYYFGIFFRKGGGVSECFSFFVTACDFAICTYELMICHLALAEVK